MTDVRHRVVAAMAVVKLAGARDGRGVVHLAHGNLLPADADPVHLRHLIATNIVEVVDWPAAA